MDCRCRASDCQRPRAIKRGEPRCRRGSARPPPGRAACRCPRRGSMVVAESGGTRRGTRERRADEALVTRTIAMLLRDDRPSQVDPTDWDGVVPRLLRQTTRRDHIPRSASIPYRPEPWGSRRYQPRRAAVKSIPARSEVNAAPSISTLSSPVCSEGSWKLPASSRLAKMHQPDPSNHNAFAIVAACSGSGRGVRRRDRDRAGARHRRARRRIRACRPARRRRTREPVVGRLSTSKVLAPARRPSRHGSLRSARSRHRRSAPGIEPRRAPVPAAAPRAASSRALSSISCPAVQDSPATR